MEFHKIKNGLQIVKKETKNQTEGSTMLESKFCSFEQLKRYDVMLKDESGILTHDDHNLNPC